MNSKQVTLDNEHYWVDTTPSGNTVIYKRYKTGEYKGASYYKKRTFYNSSMRHIPKLNSTVARILAAADGQ